jgi:hypothetical protein
MSSVTPLVAAVMAQQAGMVWEAAQPLRASHNVDCLTPINFNRK